VLKFHALNFVNNNTYIVEIQGERKELVVKSAIVAKRLFLHAGKTSMNIGKQDFFNPRRKFTILTNFSWFPIPHYFIQRSLSSQLFLLF
jgi:hypothetical protein